MACQKQLFSPPWGAPGRLQEVIFGRFWDVPAQILKMSFCLLFFSHSWRFFVLLFKGLRPPCRRPPRKEGHEDTRPRGYEATGLEPPLEALLGASWGPSWGPLASWCSWGPLGHVLWPLGHVLGRPGRVLGRPGRVPGASGARLGVPRWVQDGSKMGPRWVPRGVPR